MAGFPSMYESLFRHFSVAGILVSGSEFEPVTEPVRVIIEFGVDEIDEYNQLVGRVDKVSFKNPVSPSRGNRIDVSEGDFAGKYTIGRKLENNGYISAFTIARVSA